MASADSSQLYVTALRLLTRREYSKVRLEKKLIEKGFDPKEVGELLPQLEELGYLSDRRFALSRLREWVRKGHGPASLRMKVKREGVACTDDLIHEAFEEVETDTNEQISRLIEKRLQSSPAPQSPEDLLRIRKRVFDFCLRRGHGAPSIQKELNRQLKTWAKIDPGASSKDLF